MKMRQTVLLLPLLLGLLSCGERYNPFADSSNARMHIMAEASDMGSDDTIHIYKTYTLTLAATVCELIDSFSLRAEGNRFWSDTVVRNVASDDYYFAISLHDTGWKRFAITTHRASGDYVTEEVTVRAKSPLLQADIDTTLDAEVTFSTPSVGDSVWYHWSLRGDFNYIFDSRFPELTRQFDIAGEYEGALWVSTDSAGQLLPSPKSPFNLRLSDNAGPLISCRNGIVRGDTVYTGDELFTLELYITDPSGLKRATADNKPFDHQNPPHYAITYNDISTFTAASPRAVAVRAVDRSDNATDSLFYVVFDSSLPGSRSTLIKVESVRDTVVATGSNYVMVGSVVDYTREVVELQGLINGTLPISAQRVPIDQGVGLWGVELQLNEGGNMLELTATDTLGSPLAEKTVTVFYDRDAPDTTSPTIVDVAVNGVTAPPNQTVFIREETAALEIFAFDQSGIADVTVNGATATARKGHLWSLTLGPVTRESGMNVTVTATDIKGMSSVQEFILKRNAVPFIDFAWPERFFANNPYSYPVQVVDDDEQVAVSMSGTPGGMVFERTSGVNAWRLAWTPSESDTGSYIIPITLNDTHEESTFVWSFDVLRDSSQLVSFATKANELPGVLEATRDMVNASLRLAPGKGTAPFTYHVWLEGESGHLLDTTTTALSVPFGWVPEGAQVGEKVLMMKVTDAQGDTDFLYRSLEIVPRNYDPCRIHRRYSAGTVFTADSAIDKGTTGNAFDPDTVWIDIEDKDHPATERYTVSVTKDNITTVKLLDSAGTFSVVVNPSSEKLRDTIRVVVSDLTGGTDSVRLVVDYTRDGGGDVPNITINTAAASVAETVTDFPLLVRLNSTNFDFSPHSDTPPEFRFSRLGKSLPYEVERWSASGKTAEIWVLVDTVHPGSTSQGISMEVVAGGSDNSRGESVFDVAKGFAAVWHMRADHPSQGCVDATANNNDMTALGNWSGYPSFQQGAVGQAFEFDGLTNYLTTPDPASTLNFGSAMTVSFWVWWGSGPSDTHMIIGKQYGNEAEDCWALYIDSLDGRVRFGAHRDPGKVKSVTPIPKRQWTHVAAVFNNGSLQVYIDGRLDAQTAGTIQSLRSDNTEVTIGAQQNLTFNDWFPGQLDEMRLSNVARSESWLKLSYETQKPGTTLITVR